MKQPDWDKLVDNKPLIKQLVEENKWEEIHELLKLQKRYDYIEKYKSAEKSSFGFAKGFMNVIDINEMHWKNFLKDYFLTKYPDIVVLDYKTFFKKVRASSVSYSEFTYRDDENKLGKLNLNEKIHLINIDTRNSQIYGHMLRRMKKDLNMELNIYSAMAPNYRGKPLLQMKQLRLYQHMRYSSWSYELMKYTNTYDYLIN